MLRGSVNPLLEAEDMALDMLPGDVLPGHHQGGTLRSGTKLLLHRVPFQDTAPTSVYSRYYPWPLLLPASRRLMAFGWHLLDPPNRRGPPAGYSVPCLQCSRL